MTWVPVRAPPHDLDKINLLKLFLCFLGYLLFPTIERMYESPQGFLAWIQVSFLFLHSAHSAWLLVEICG
jgi:hypothetical protein